MTPEVKPHCPECKATIETVGAGHYTEGSIPFWVVFCPYCGCSLGIHFEFQPKKTLFDLYHQ